MWAPWASRGPRAMGPGEQGSRARASGHVSAKGATCGFSTGSRRVAGCQLVSHHGHVMTWVKAHHGAARDHVVEPHHWGRPWAVGPRGHLEEPPLLHEWLGRPSPGPAERALTWGCIGALLGPRGMPAQGATERHSWVSREVAATPPPLFPQ